MRDHREPTRGKSPRAIRGAPVAGIVSGAGGRPRRERSRAWRPGAVPGCARRGGDRGETRGAGARLACATRSVGQLDSGAASGASRRRTRPGTRRAGRRSRCPSSSYGRARDSSGLGAGRRRDGLNSGGGRASSCEARGVRPAGFASSRVSTPAGRRARGERRPRRGWSPSVEVGSRGTTPATRRPRYRRGRRLRRGSTRKPGRSGGGRTGAHRARPPRPPRRSRGRTRDGWRAVRHGSRAISSHGEPKEPPDPGGPDVSPVYRAARARQFTPRFPPARRRRRNRPEESAEISGPGRPSEDHPATAAPTASGRGAGRRRGKRRRAGGVRGRPPRRGSR